MPGTNSGVVTAQTIGELDVTITTKWQVEYSKLIKAQSKQMEKFTTVIPTDGLTVNVPFSESWERLDKIEFNERPAYMKWLAQYFTRPFSRYAKGLSQSRVGWKKPDVQRLLMSKLDALVADAAHTRLRRIFTILAEGDTNSEFATYDGKNLFANDHTVNGQTFDNLRSGALTGANIVAAKNVLQNIPMGPGGEAMDTDLATFTLITPTQLEYTAKEILEGDVIAQDNRASKNIYQNMVDWITTGKLTDANDWYLIMSLPGGMTPFLTIESTESDGGRLKSFVDPMSEHVAEYQEFRWLCDLMEETWPVHPWQMVKYVNS